MGTHVVPERAQGGSIDGGWWWLRSLLRAAIALLAFLFLWISDDRSTAWLLSPGDTGRLDNSLWFASVGWTVGAGIMFGLATWLPFTKLRYLPSRLLLAIFASVPVAHFWWVFLHPYRPVTDWLGDFRWFDKPQIQFVCAVLSGVAIASGFRERTSASGTRSVE